MRNFSETAIFIIIIFKELSSQIKVITNKIKLWQTSNLKLRCSLIGHQRTMSYVTAEEGTSNSLSAMLKHVNTVSSNFFAVIAHCLMTSTFTKRHQLSKNLKQECNNGKNLPKMRSNSSKLLTQTIQIINHSSSTLIMRPYFKNPV